MREKQNKQNGKELEQVYENNNINVVSGSWLVLFMFMFHAPI